MMFTSSILGRPLAKRQTWHAKPPESCVRRRRHPQKLNPSLPERAMRNYALHCHDVWRDEYPDYLPLFEEWRDAADAYFEE